MEPEREQTLFLCHKPLAVKENTDLIQKVETSNWNDSDLIRKQNRPLDWWKFFHFKLETKIIQVFFPSLTASTKICPEFDEAAAQLVVVLWPNIADSS